MLDEEMSFLDEKTKAKETGWSSLADLNPKLPDYKEAKLKMIEETLKIHSSISSSVGVSSRMDYAELKRNLMEFDNDSVSGGHRSKSHKSMIDFEREIETSQQSQMPAAECRLSKILGSSRRCLRELSAVKVRLAKLVDQEWMKSPSDYLLMEKLGEILIIIAKEAFIPIHQINKISLRLIDCEDFIRNPKSNAFDSSSDESIGISEACLVAQGRIRFCLDKATEYYNKFETQNAHEDLQIIMLTVVNSLKDLLDLSSGFHKVAKALITVEKDLLEKYLKALSSIERSDLLEEVQSLRRSIDEIAISIEKIGWAASVFHRYSRNKEFENGKSSTTVRESSKHLSHESSRTLRNNDTDEKDRRNRSDHSRDHSERDLKEVSSKSSKLTRNQLERSMSVKFKDEKNKDEKSNRKKSKGQRLQDVEETDEEFQRNTLKREDRSPSRNRHDHNEKDKGKGRGRSKSKAKGSEDSSSDEIDPVYTRSLEGHRNRKRSKSSGATKSRGGHKEV